MSRNFRNINLYRWINGAASRARRLKTPTSHPHSSTNYRGTSPQIKLAALFRGCKKWIWCILWSVGFWSSQTGPRRICWPLSDMSALARFGPYHAHYFSAVSYTMGCTGLSLLWTCILGDVSFRQTWGTPHLRLCSHLISAFALKLLVCNYDRVCEWRVIYFRVKSAFDGCKMTALWTVQNRCQKVTNRSIRRLNNKFT